MTTEHLRNLPRMENDMEGCAEAMRALVVEYIPERMHFGTHFGAHVEGGVLGDELVSMLAAHPMFADGRYWFGILASVIKTKRRLNEYDVRDCVCNGIVVSTWFDDPGLTAYQYRRACEWIREAALVPFLTPAQRARYDIAVAGGGEEGDW